VLRPPNSSIAVLFAAVCLSSTGMFTAITLGAIIAVETAGSRAASGLPAALAIFGTALGAFVLGNVIGKRGWRLGMQTGWFVGAIGAAIAATGVALDSFPLVLVGMFGIGSGNAGSQLSRYAAAETVAPSMRGTAVSWTVWAAAVGAVLGPLGLGPVGDVAREFGAQPGVGGFVMVLVMFLASAAVASVFRPQKYVAPDSDGADAPATGTKATSPRGRLITAIVCLITAQASMVAVMAITPVHLHDGGHAYGVVGTVMSGHFVGMFALAPLVGWTVDRLSTNGSIILGLAVLSAGALSAALLPVAHGRVLSLPLLLIGLGWCVCFVAASAEVAAATTSTAQKGRVDSLVWVGSATASIASGLVFSWSGYDVVALVAGLVVVGTAATVTVRAAVVTREVPA
jgi:MFS family permease